MLATVAASPPDTSAMAIESPRPAVDQPVGLGADLTPNMPLVVVVPPTDLQDYHIYLNGRSPLQITNFSGPGSKRVVAELILLHQALDLGGFNKPIELQPVGDYKRTLALLNQNQAGLRGLTVWREDVPSANTNILVSAPLFRDGEFVAGLYTHADNKVALGAVSLYSLRRLSAVSNRNWTVDWRTLESMGLSSLYHNPNYSAMIKVVFSRRADFMLAPFPGGKNLNILADELTLVPIPNIKVSLQGSRHWVASRGRGAEAFAAIEVGLARLRQQGALTRAFTESGVFNPLVEDWEVVNR